MAIIDDVQCDSCGKPMTVERPTGHYCSANCRLRAFRARKAAAKPGAAETRVSTPEPVGHIRPICSRELQTTRIRT